MLISWVESVGSGDVVGAGYIAAACALWALDNNLTQGLTIRDPFAVVRFKTGVAAVVNTTLAVGLGARWPGVGFAVVALVVGAVSYGLSVVLDAYALRLLGAARESAVFATAPFVGAIVAVPVLSEQLPVRVIAAAVVMAAGVGLMLTERHDHLHVHEPLVHEHRHTHDVHHQHEHSDGERSIEPHSHVHAHQRAVHRHGHVSELHHRHDHQRGSG